MNNENRLSKTISFFDRLPSALRSRAITILMGRMVPFVGTSGIIIEKMSPEEVIVTVPNRRAVRNHIRGVHAAAMTLAAETASGFVVGMNVPDDRLPLMKSLKVTFRKRLKGSLRVEARLDKSQRDMIRNNIKGEVLVPVKARGEDGDEPVVCEMLWAWIPSRKK